jgi:hypothetical protein
MTRHQYWRAEYRRKRYLEHVNQDELEERVRDITTNILSVGPAGQLHPVGGATDGTDYWIILFTHVLEELSIRNGGFRPGFMKNAYVPKASWPNSPRAALALGDRKFEAGKCLFKFGKEKHLRQALKTGNIRISPASSYSDPSLNYAVRDDELTFTIRVPGRRVFIQKVDETTLQSAGKAIPVEGNISMTRRVPTDYLVFCLSARYELRALDDFEADCCLVIKDSKAFINRLLEATAPNLQRWTTYARAVDYLDPLNTKPEDVKPYFAKHFRFAYQNEVRVVWLPPEPLPKAHAIFASLGSLEDIGELLLAPAVS